MGPNAKRGQEEDVVVINCSVVRTRIVGWQPYVLPMNASNTAGLTIEPSVNELGACIIGLSARLASATCRWLLMIADFDRREGYLPAGLPSTSRWLSHHCGIAHRTAVEHVRVARALAEFPPLAAEMSEGRLSYSQVRAISRVPSPGEHEVVADLIQLAEHGTAAQLETVARGMRTVERNEDGDTVPEEYLRSGWTQQSLRTISARLEPEHGALVDRAIDEVARAEGLTRTEALVRIAEIALVVIEDAERRKPRPLRGDERAAVVVHVDAADLAQVPPPVETGTRSAERGGSARVHNGPALRRQVVARLLCSARMRAVIRGGDGSVLDLGRSRRTVTTTQFRALLIRDHHCAHPGCTSVRGLEAHHVVHWIDGGPTDMANLVLLCERHHHLLHDDAFRIEALGEQRFRFFGRDGRLLPDHVHPDSFVTEPGPVDAEHPVAATAATPQWYGDRLDREWAISVLSTRRAMFGSADEATAVHAA